MDQIGLQAILDDKDFQAGLSRYIAGQEKMQRVTAQVAKNIGAVWDEQNQTFRKGGIAISQSRLAEELDKLRAKFPPVAQEARKTGTAVEASGRSFSALGHILSTAVGTLLGLLSAQLLPKLGSALLAPLNVTRAYGEAMDNFSESLGFSNEAAAQFVVGMKLVGLAPEEGTQALGVFIRNVAATRASLAQAGAAFADAASEIRDNFTAAVAEASGRRLEIWSDLAEQVRGIESELADNIASIQEGLNERLADLAEQRADVDRDLEKDLAKLDRDYQRNRRNTRGRQRRELKEQYEEQRRTLIEAAAERKAQLDKQEARERAQAAKQIALAEKVAAKQIAAAEKAADKQIAAIEKALKKEEEARDKALAKAQKTFASTAGSSPFAKALADLGLRMDQVTDQAGNLTEQGLDLIMDAFAKLPAGVKASNIAMELFGRNGLKFLDWMRADREEAKRLAKELGLVFDPQVSKDFDRQLSKLQLTFDALALNIGKHALPYLTDFLKTVNDIAQGGMPVFVDLLDRVNAGFKKGGLEGALDALQAWADDPKNRTRIDAVGQKIGNLLGDAVGFVIGTAGFAAKTIGKLVDKTGEWAATGDGQKSINSASEKIGNALATGLELFVKTSGKVLDFMVALGGRVGEWCASDKPGGGQETFRKIADGFANGVSAALGEKFKNFDWWGPILSGGVVGQSMQEDLDRILKKKHENQNGSGADAGNTYGGGVASGMQAGIVASLPALVGTLLQTTTDALTTATPDVRPAEQEFGRALVDEMDYGIEWKRLDLWSTIVDTVTEALRYAQPWAVVRGFSFGQSLGQAISDGLGSTLSLLESSLQNIVTLMTTIGLLDANPDLNLTRTRHFGGPIADSGLYNLLAGEYVLNRQQARVLAPVLANGGNTYNTFYASHTWNGPASSFDKGEIYRLSRAGAEEAIAAHFGGG